jgi:hypothetical protein
VLGGEDLPEQRARLAWVRGVAGLFGDLLG